MKKNSIIYLVLSLLLISCDVDGLFEVDIDAQTKSNQTSPI